MCHIFNLTNSPVKLGSVFGINPSKLNIGMDLYFIVLNNMSKVPIDPNTVENFTEGWKNNNGFSRISRYLAVLRQI